VGASCEVTNIVHLPVFELFKLQIFSRTFFFFFFETLQHISEFLVLIWKMDPKLSFENKVAFCDYSSTLCASVLVHLSPGESMWGSSFL
jgi:hypothetical protein